MQGDIDTAGRYYMASVNEISKPQDFVLPYIGRVPCAHALSLKILFSIVLLNNFSAFMHAHVFSSESSVMI